MGFSKWIVIATNNNWEDLKNKGITIDQFHYLVDEYEAYCSNNNLSSVF